MEEKSISELLRAKAHVWNHTLKFINSMSLKCAVELGIPDIIHSHGQPMTLSQLVMALQINPSRASNVRRLMRILVHSGFFTLQKLVGDEEGYALTEASRLLLKDSPFNESSFVLMILDHVVLKPWELVSTWLKNDAVGTFTTPFDVAHGETVWNFAAHEPRFNVLFNEAMASDGPLVSCVLRTKCREVFEGLSSLVDVGGGTGNLAKSLAETFPNLKCTVLDLPHVVAVTCKAATTCIILEGTCLSQFLLQKQFY
uniref:Trans-resveratrol di-O-methyltransferase-like n=1 Tax=Rhizophora mucronata TaxID=61149 RepID=A0A2P2INP9_RHIMU